MCIHTQQLACSGQRHAAKKASFLLTPTPLSPITPPKTKHQGFAEPSPYFGVSAPSFALVTQLGYFTSFDRGERLQISNSPAYTRFVRAGGSGATCANIVKGTAMTGGSSGSPWVLNLGADAALSDGASYLYQNARNIVVGVSSWCVGAAVAAGGW